MKYFFCFIVSLLLGNFAFAEDFEDWKEGFVKEALNQGLSKEFMGKILPEMTLLPQVIKSDKKQSEYVLTFWEYVNRVVIKKRIEDGEKMAYQHRKNLQKTYQIYGIPTQYIVALWGAETHFGTFKGNIEVLKALTTLAYDKRRRSFFTKELISFLKIMQENHWENEVIKGSWAGAFGNFQFMPSTFLAYGVDADGDGKKDIIYSVSDSFASASNYLLKAGWHGKTRWGREVKLTKYIPQDKRNLKMKVKDWMKLGIVPADGTKWTEDSLLIEADLLLPMGLTGPAFLTYPNFKVLMKWNRSKLYALSVGLLADRISGQSQKIYKSPKRLPLSWQEIACVQEKLTELGYYKDKIDGIVGYKTKKALDFFEKENQPIPMDCITNDFLTDFKKLKFKNKGR